MLEFIANLPKWIKITGANGIGIIVLALILLAMFYEEPELVEIPSKIDEIRENVTKEVENASMTVAKESSSEVISTFHKAGEDLAEDVDDPRSKKSIITSMDIAGIMLAFLIILAFIKTITGIK